MKYIVISLTILFVASCKFQDTRLKKGDIVDLHKKQSNISVVDTTSDTEYFIEENGKCIIQYKRIAINPDRTGGLKILEVSCN